MRSVPVVPYPVAAALAAIQDGAAVAVHQPSATVATAQVVRLTRLAVSVEAVGAIAVVGDQATHNNGWRTLDRRLMLDRSPFARIYDDDIQLPDGQIIHNFVRVELPDFVMVFTLTTDNQVA